jgi:probable F420-dependent oxidoreductase
MRRCPRVNLGVVFPHLDIPPLADDVVAFATGVEELGFTHLLLYDHVTLVDPVAHPHWLEIARRGGATAARPYDSRDTFHEVMVLMGFLAGVTSLELATGVLVLPQRQTALVAKQAAQVDILCGGRLRLGAGIGWNRLEYQSLGADFATRGRRIEAQIRALRAYWSGASPGPSDGLEESAGMVLNPLPVQQPIPIWLSGGRDRALERVGRLGDGWLPMSEDPDASATSWALVREAAEMAGRDPSRIGIQARITSAGGSDAARARECAQGWSNLGATHAAINTMGHGLRSVEEHLDALASIHEA